MLDIRLLGSPIITVDGSPIEVDTRKAIAVLAYLAVEGSADRDTLGAMFWSESPADRARAALRRTLSALRSAIGPDSLGSDRRSVGLTGSFSIDIAAFDALVDSTAGHGHDKLDVCPDCSDPLRAAADLYRGDFLGTFGVRDAPDFEGWARAVAESYRQKAGEVLRRLATARAAAGDYTDAIAVTRRWIELDELHEPAHRLSMILHAWAGDRPGAMQAYRACVSVLDRELGVAPLEETTELYEAILDEDLPPSPGPRRPVKAQPRKAPASGLLDRVAELRELELALSPGDRVRAVVLTGAPWMGKTRLLEEVVRTVGGRGSVVAFATAYQSEVSLPYGVAVQILTPLAPLVADAPSWVSDELSRLLPQLSATREIRPDEPTGDVRLREAIHFLVEAVAGEHDLVIVVDDAHWIDPASADLLAFLRRRMLGAVCLALATHNTEALRPELQDIVDGAETVRLQPLRAVDLEAEHPGLDLEEIVGITGGIPMLVREAIDSDGALAESSTVTRYLESRRARMSDLGRQVLAAAAVVGQVVDLDVLRETSGRTEEELADAVEEVIGAGLLREQPDGTLRFTLDLFASASYAATTPVRRRLLHLRAARAMEDRPDPRRAFTVAEHLRAAGSDEAADRYRQAGDLAKAVFAHEEAATSYELAIALGHPEVAPIRLALAEMAIVRGDYETAMRELRTAESQAVGETRALVVHRQGEVQRILGRFDLAEEAFSMARSQHPLPASLFADWALLRHRVGDAPSAADLAGQAVSAADDGGDRRLLARALNVLGAVTPDPVRAASYVDAALDMSPPEDPARMAALNNKAYLLAADGEPDRAVALIEEAVDLAERTGSRHQQAALLNHLADLHHNAGRRSEAEATLTQAVTLFSDVSAGDWEPEVWLMRHW